MKQNNIYKGNLGDQSEFSFCFASWANNHRGRAKAKRTNKRSAKRRIRQKQRRELDDTEIRNAQM